VKPTQTLPETYSLAWDVNMKRDMRLNILLQVIGTFWLALVGLVLWWAFQLLRPGLGLDVWFSGDAWVSLLGFLLALVVSITLHEVVHGVFFWWLTGHPPKFGLGPGYAFAAMPGWYLPKRQYLVVGLAPLVVLTILGLLYVPFLPNWLIVPFFGGLVFNAGGAIGDIYICLRIAREAEDVWVLDHGDGFEVYRRG
jgi:hypothetical protein